MLRRRLCCRAHDHLFERHSSVVIGHIKLDFAPFRVRSFAIAISFDFAAILKERALSRHGDDADQWVRRSLKLGFLPVSTSQLTDCPSSWSNAGIAFYKHLLDTIRFHCHPHRFRNCRATHFFLLVVPNTFYSRPHAPFRLRLFCFYGEDARRMTSTIIRSEGR
jgi:hypothetical protein